VQIALAGHDDTRTIAVDGQTVRVYSEPVLVDGRVVGAIQTARGQSAHESELRLVSIASLAGIALGALVSVPSGMFLARRAMRPISAAFDRQRAFVADASHELRTPLTVVRANAELVNRLPETSESVKTEVTYILGEVEGMTKLVDDLLLLARLDANTAILERADRDLDEIVGLVLAPMEAVAASHELTLIHHARGHPVVVCVDADRVRQVVRIMIDNAIKYTPPGGTVDVTVGHHSGGGIVTVKDSGIGIAPGDQASVFDRFHRIDADRSRATGGSGLGLAIARALVEAHGGAIGLRSEPGKGSTFWFTLPHAC
jgi:signal transduction histidine kinase